MAGTKNAGRGRTCQGEKRKGFERWRTCEDVTGIPVSALQWRVSANMSQRKVLQPNLKTLSYLRSRSLFPCGVQNGYRLNYKGSMAHVPRVLAPTVSSQHRGED